jgi:putative oxidoreductase
MKQIQNALNLVGRLLVVALFLPAGLSKITGFAATVGYFGFLGIPAPTLAVVATIALEVLGSIALLVGYQTRVTAIVLAIFTLAASIAGHAFWAAPADQAFVAQLLFFKNVAVMGGLLVLASAGAGQWSVDGKNASK